MIDYVTKILKKIEEEKRQAFIIIDSEDLPEVTTKDIYKAIGKREFCNDLIRFIKELQSNE